jgi:hypothetical protein
MSSPLHPFYVLLATNKALDKPELQNAPGQNCHLLLHHPPHLLFSLFLLIAPKTPVSKTEALLRQTSKPIFNLIPTYHIHTISRFSLFVSNTPDKPTVDYSSFHLFCSFMLLL